MKRAVLSFLLILAAAILGCTQTEQRYDAQVASDGKVIAPDGKVVVSPPDEFVGYEKYLDTMLNQGHGVGHDVYDPAVEKFRKFEAFGIPKEDIERVREKLQRLNPETETQAEKQSTVAPSAIKKGLLSPRGCNGTGSFKLGASPLALEDIEKIRPMGGLTSVHITPTDHQYWDSVGSDGKSDDTTNLDRFKVYAPSDGFIVDIEQHRDYRVVIEHSCTFYTIFIHVDKLSDKIMSAAGFKEGEVGNHAWPRIPVKEREIIGSIGTGKLDFSVVDEGVTLTGFVNQESYEGEPWKIHTVDTFDYYSEPLKSQLIAKNVRNATPLGGKIDYDIKGRLVGNWFREGTNKYKRTQDTEYWVNHLSIVYDSIEPSQVRISMGNFNGRGDQLGVKGNKPDPAEVEVGETVKYELVPFDYYIGDTATKWNPAKFSTNIKARNLDEVRGVALFKVLTENRLQAEFFHDKKADEVTGFTASATIYER